MDTNKQEQSKENGMPHLVENIDAVAWVDEWLRAVEEIPSISTDRNAMIGWFANAIMAGYDEGYRRGKRSSRKRLARVFRYPWGFDLIVKIPKMRQFVLTSSKAGHPRYVFVSHNGVPNQALFFLWPFRRPLRLR